MRSIVSIFLGVCILFFSALPGIAQEATKPDALKRKTFFTDSSILEMELTTDLRFLLSKKPDEEYVPGSVVIKMPDGAELRADTVGIRTRGNYRRENCELASLMFKFNQSKDSKNALSNLKRLKFVAGCRRNVEVDQLVLKEYLVYKMYQLYTPVSFKVRMVRAHFVDINKKVKDYYQYGFFIEDIDDLADRNDMLERYNHGFLTEQTNREHTTLVSVFQFMIGNTDWAVPVDHNIKLVSPKEDTMKLPLIVPYDFDYCGMVNASYAVPHESLEIESVTQRTFRGFARSMDELKPVAAIFNTEKAETYALVENHELLSKATKKMMVKYLDEFYAIIDSEKSMYDAFVRGARTQ